jgi:uncharacterized protein YdaU (DUF1376 family)
MTCEQLGIYERLRDHQWLEGSLPTDLAQLAVIIGHNMTAIRLRKIWAGVAPCFPNKRGRLQNARLERQRKTHQTFIETQSKNGAKGAKKRWGRHSGAINSPIANDSSASSSASATALQEEPPNPLSAKGGVRRYTRADLKEAQRIRQLHFGRCGHEPTCEGGIECEVRTAIDIAERRKQAAS